MVLGTGIDLVDINRFRNLRYFDRVAEYILSSTELEDLSSKTDPALYLASRFAIKEAVIKACPTLLTYHDVIVTKDGPKPIVQLKNPHEASSSNMHISLSHTQDHTVASAIFFAA